MQVCGFLLQNSLYRTLSVSSPLFPYCEQTNRAYPCYRSSSWPTELPTHSMAAHMFGSDSTKRNACLLPFPTNVNIMLTHAYQAVLYIHLHQAIVQWESCQSTSFVASYRYNHVHWVRHEVASVCQFPPVVLTIRPLCCRRLHYLQKSEFATLSRE